MFIIVPRGSAVTSQTYYYHPDHLGSSSQITDGAGNLVQHLEYLPFGEIFLDRSSSSDTWNTPYKFSGKELDPATGLYYFGARYYAPKTSVWLGVDPLAVKYPSTSAYMYCLGNPVVYFDPDGERVTMTSFQATAKAGMMYGLGGSFQAGAAYDECGTTVFKTFTHQSIRSDVSDLKYGSSTPEITLGFDLSMSVGFLSDRKSDTFKEFLSKMAPYSLSVPGLEFTFGDGVIGYDIGPGWSAGLMNGGNADYINSLSYTEEELDQFKGHPRHGGHFTVGEEKKNMTDGKVTSYTGQLLYNNNQEKGISTGITVTSPALENENSRMWETPGYTENYENN